MKSKIKLIELRSEEVQEILGRPPRWILRWGITLLFSIFILLLFGTWFFKYPEIIKSDIIVTNKNIPATLVAKTSGRIVQFNISDKQFVEENKVLAVIESSTNYREVLIIDSLLSIFNIPANDTIKIHVFENFKLGIIQPEYKSFLKACDDYNKYYKVTLHTQKCFSIKKHNQKKKEQLIWAIKQSYNTFINRLYQWKNKYLFISPISGRVIIKKTRNENQEISTGDKVFKVIPDDLNQIAGQLTIPIQSSDKVKIGQKVNIKFYNYPYLEYGIVIGKVKQLIPVENNYIVEIELPKGLETSYGKQINVSRELKGSAEIITNDIRLFEKLLMPFSSIINKNL